MQTILIFAQLIISISLISLILLQAKGVGLGRAWGGSGDFYKSRRGVEKFIFNFTIFVAAMFMVSSILNILFR